MNEESSLARNNTALAIFVPDYIDMKEQKEYVRWLENVKSFVEA